MCSLSRGLPLLAMFGHKYVANFNNIFSSILVEGPLCACEALVIIYYNGIKAPEWLSRNSAQKIRLRDLDLFSRL